jgi:hypothetical protein
LNLNMYIAFCALVMLPSKCFDTIFHSRYSGVLR